MIAIATILENTARILGAVIAKWDGTPEVVEHKRCGRCGGTGKYRGHGACFTCHGAGVWLPATSHHAQLAYKENRIEFYNLTSRSYVDIPVRVGLVRIRFPKRMNAIQAAAIVKGINRAMGENSGK